GPETRVRTPPHLHGGRVARSDPAPSRSRSAAARVRRLRRPTRDARVVDEQGFTRRAGRNPETDRSASRSLMDTWIFVAGWTLVHFVWQGAVIGAGAALGLYLLRGATSNVRYAFASGALLLMLMSLVVTAWLVSSPAATPIVVRASRLSSISPAITS